MQPRTLQMVRPLALALHSLPVTIQLLSNENRAESKSSSNSLLGDHPENVLTVPRNPASPTPARLGK